MCGGGSPHGHWKTTTITAGIRLCGLSAPMVLEGAMNGLSFLNYVEQVLAPDLTKGDIVVMDNLNIHKVKGGLEAIKTKGAKLL